MHMTEETQTPQTSESPRREINADDVLLILNGYSRLITSLTYCVITDPADEYWDNASQTYVRDESWWPFHMGEILVLGPDGREPFNEGRKPSKWDVITEETSDLVEAIKISIRALEYHEQKKNGKLEPGQRAHLERKRRWLAQLEENIYADLV